MASAHDQVVSRSLPAGLERVALWLVQEGHEPDHAVAMGIGLVGESGVRPQVLQQARRLRYLTMTPQEREQFARSLQARRVLVEGMGLSLVGEGVRDGAVVSAHALCESVHSVRSPVLRIGGGAASSERVHAARVRLAREVDLLDGLVEAAVEEPASDHLSRADQSAKANPRVVHLQNRLNSLGYRVQPDGVFGAVTEENIKDLQGKAGLDTSGVVDAATRDVLRNNGRPSWAVDPLLNQGDPNDPNAPVGAPPEGAAQPARDPRKQAKGDGKKTTAADKKKGRKLSVSLDLGEAWSPAARAASALSRHEHGGGRDSAMRAVVGNGRLVAHKSMVAQGFAVNELQDAVSRGVLARHQGQTVAGSAAKVWYHAPGDKVAKRRAQSLFRMQEAHSKGDSPLSQLPSKCPTCGAHVKKSGVCQRGHSVKKLMEATERQLVVDGALEETGWTPQAREAALLKRRGKMVVRKLNERDDHDKRVMDQLYGGGQRMSERQLAAAAKVPLKHLASMHARGLLDTEEPPAPSGEGQHSPGVGRQRVYRTPGDSPASRDARMEKLRRDTTRHIYDKQVQEAWGPAARLASARERHKHKHDPPRLWGEEELEQREREVGIEPLNDHDDKVNAILGKSPWVSEWDFIRAGVPREHLVDMERRGALQPAYDNIGDETFYAKPDEKSDSPIAASRSSSDGLRRANLLARAAEWGRGEGAAKVPKKSNPFFGPIDDGVPKASDYWSRGGPPTRWRR